MSRIAVFPIDAIGHVKSVLSAVAPLARDRRLTVTGYGRSFLEEAFARAGLGFEATMAEPQPDDPQGDLRWKTFVRPGRDLGRTLEAVDRFRPDVVLYDPFSLSGRMAAAVSSAPSAAFVTMHGYGVLADDFVRANGWDRDDVLEANGAYRRAWGVDLRAEGALPVLFPSRDMTLVHTTRRLHNVVRPSRQPLLHCLLRDSARETPIGCWADWDAVAPRSEEAPDEAADRALLARLAAAKAEGRRVALFSLGTVITDFRYGTPVGGAPSGSAFLRQMLSHAFEAARRDPGLLLVASVGRRYLADRPLEAPPNAMVQPNVPQAQILRHYADVFITHHGANSEREAVLAGVGMVSLPGAGDQAPNARAAIANGAALALWDLEDPFGSCTAESVATAIDRVSREPGFRAACEALACEMRQPAGTSSLADRLLALAGAGAVAEPAEASP
ncbi:MULTISPECIES: nucleotide disphospho-sugar-binding domain-containing protein [unclassified Phenylobacterium]|uniref:nucleotide disphospho-sugar-binding domain-containing protein n=1 Tax=unclassified Phenylobacterium TaxID=2640670 RepID=UPI000839E2AE|nr:MULTISPECIES: nucleotide disphospho-sugar-binding domain-containing protein [unclassified Phenylobacterium]